MYRHISTYFIYIYLHMYIYMYIHPKQLSKGLLYQLQRSLRLPSAPSVEKEPEIPEVEEYEEVSRPWGCG